MIVDAAAPPEKRPRTTYQEREKMTLGERIGTDEIVFVGTITALGKEPGYWSGFVTAWQKLELDVVDVIEGDLPHHVGVNMPLSAGSDHVKKDTPGLLPSRFPIGQKLLIGAERTQNGDLVDRDFAPWSAKLEAEVRASSLRRR